MSECDKSQDNAFTFFIAYSVHIARSSSLGAIFIVLSKAEELIILVNSILIIIYFNAGLYTVEPFHGKDIIINIGGRG